MAGKFFTIREWVPSFVPDESTLTHTAIWVRLPQLPIEYYDKSILEKVGQNQGNLLKIDACTSATLRGRYVNIFIEIPLETSVRTVVTIGSHKQKVIYEGDGIMCKGCA